MCSFWSLSANGGEKIESLSFCVIYIRNTCLIVHWRKNNDGCHSAFCCCKRVHRFSTKDRFPARAWSHLLSFWNLVCKYILNFMSMSKYTTTCTLDYNYFLFNHNMFYLMFCSLSYITRAIWGTSLCYPMNFCWLWECLPLFCQMERSTVVFPWCDIYACRHCIKVIHSNCINLHYL